MSLHHTLLSSLIRTASISIFLALGACDGSSRDANSGETYSGNSLVVSNTYASETIDNATPGSIIFDGVPSPTSLLATSVRYGLVSLRWESSEGDIYQVHPEGDSVSYYSVYRNGEHLVDAFSPMIEDASAPSGDVVYAVEAIKYRSSPEYSIEKSARQEIVISVPSSDHDRQKFGGERVDSKSYDETLDKFKSCATAHASTTFESICVNEFGYAWPIFTGGKSGELLGVTSTIAGSSLISVRNTPAEFGPVPDLPTWSVTQMATGESLRREVLIDERFLQGAERYVVNGVAADLDGTVFISGTLYQSFFPRNFAPSPTLLPVTNAYYIAQFDLATATLLQFKRFPLEDGPGAAATINNGVLEMHSVGQVSFHSTETLSKLGSLAVAGYPSFGDDQNYYTRAFDEADYYKFARTK